MPIHDWSRVDAGIFHDFHVGWIGALRSALNQGVLPDAYYALIEPYAGKVEPDILTLHSRFAGQWPEPPISGDPLAGSTAVLDGPPEVDVIQQAEDAHYLLKQSSLVIREVLGDRVVALLEIVSHGNKSGEFACERLVDKVVNAMMSGIHVLVIDLQPPGTWDPRGIHDAIWRAIGQGGFEPPAGKPLTLASYTGSPDLTCYVKSAGIGDRFVALPLFLDAEHYVGLPLEQTYSDAFAGVPAVWRARIKGVN
jgi:hypothetical protein